MARKPAVSGGNRLSPGVVIVAAVVAAGLAYKYVQHRATAHGDPMTQSSASIPATPTAPTSVNSRDAGPEAQAPAIAITLPAGGSGSEGTIRGNSPPSENVGPGAVAAKTKPSNSGVLPVYARAHAKADQAFGAGQYLEPTDSSALSWARKAKSQGDPGAAKIEQQVFSRVMEDIASARQSHSYEQAQAQVYQLASSFPEHTELRQLQDDIHVEQQHYTQQQDQRRQGELQAQVKKFAVQHRHGTGSNFCTGIITITPDGTAKYDCNTADSGGRCEHAVFPAGSLKEVKLRGGSLHVVTRQGNFDFIGGEFALKEAATNMEALVKH